VANSRTIQVTPNGVNGSTNVVDPQSVLIGNGTVNASDLSQTKSGVGHAVDGTNFCSTLRACNDFNARSIMFRLPSP